MTLSNYVIHATPDGYALRFDGRVVDEFPTWEGVARARRAAIAADRLLVKTLRGIDARKAGA